MHQNALQVKSIDARIKKERQRQKRKTYVLFQGNMGTFRTFLDASQYNTLMLDQGKSLCVLSLTAIV